MPGRTTFITLVRNDCNENELLAFQRVASNGAARKGMASRRVWAGQLAPIAIPLQSEKRRADPLVEIGPYC